MECFLQIGLFAFRKCELTELAFPECDLTELALELAFWECELSEPALTTAKTPFRKKRTKGRGKSRTQYRNINVEQQNKEIGIVEKQKKENRTRLCT